LTGTPQENDVFNLLLLIGLFAMANIPSISTYAISGGALRRKWAKENRIVVFKISMAILLVDCLIPLLIT